MIRIWFTKTGEASYISLLDLQRVMGRCLKRSGLPVWYTMGFNPHIYMTFACPLPLGQESLVESLEVKTEEEAPALDAWKDALNKVMPGGVQVTCVETPTRKTAEIAFARYRVVCTALEAPAALDAYNAAPAALVQKKSKRGVKEMDLKENLPKVEYATNGQETTFELLLPAGDDFNLNPALLLHHLEEQFGLPAEQSAVLRVAFYTKNMEKFSA